MKGEDDVAPKIHTVILPKPGAEKEHLWVLITNPDLQNRRSHHGESDFTAIAFRHHDHLQPGAHPFIDRPTVTFYADARFVNVALLDSSIIQGVGRSHATAL